jgi:anti-sigma regulatory factor (Ser/Thr protein kinase)
MEMTTERQTICVSVKHTHDVGDCRRRTLAVADALGLSEKAQGDVALIVTELATNLVKHARGGHIYVRALPGKPPGIEIMSVDKGTGLEFELAMRDGFSTAGSPGTGLGAIRRLATRFNVFSEPGKGTVIVASLWPGGKVPAPPHVGAICLPVDGETLCGDGWAVVSRDGSTQVMVSDGLGHGPLAAEVSDRAITAFKTAPRQSPAELMETLHKALKGTRGAAIAIADLTGDTLTFAGVGNIGASLFAGTRSHGLVSMNGIVGHQIPRVSEFTYACQPSDLLVMHSDGLSGRWKIEDYPGLAFRPPELVAGIFFRDFRRTRDDATILTLRRS